MGNIKLSEKIELYIRYAIDFFDEYKDKNNIYKLLVNREDLIKQLEKTPDSFWNEVKKQKKLYVYKDIFKWTPGEDMNDRIITKFQNFYDDKSKFPVLVYQKQQELAPVYQKKLYK